MSPPDPGAAAREEAARQLVYVAAMAAAVPLLVFIERAVSSPDAAKRMRMRAAKAAEDGFTAVAMWAVRCARAARAVYDRECG